jgi:uncharacterized protein (TIGR02145 family)
MEVNLNGSYAVVKAKKSAYFEGIRTHTPTEDAFNKIIIGMQSKGTAKNLNSETGGKLIFDNGKVELDFPANVLLDQSGKPYKGTAKINARYIDPEADNFGELMPGALIGLTDADALTGLISYGMVTVEMTDNVGNKLEIAGNRAVEVTMLAILDAPTEMPIWHFNETYGIWVEAGKAKKEGSKYTFEANYFSSWNFDIPYNGVNVILQIENQDGVPLTSQYVQIFNNNDNHLKSLYTDNNGQIKIIRGPSSMKLKIKTNCAETFERSVTVTKPIEIVQVNTTELFTISGKITDCENVPVVDKNYIIEKLGDKNFVFKGKTGENGLYESTALLCNLNPEAIHEMVVSVYMSDNVIKKDTVQVIFWGNNIPLNINLCGIKELTFPTVTTASVTEIESNTATSGGEVVDEGGTEIITRGVCWSKNPNPTIADSKTTDGTGVGSFVSHLTNLEASTTYYVRAYATNSEGTAYGNELNFETPKQSYFNPDLTYGSFADPRNGQTYKTIQIGTQVWMAENLNYDIGNSWCYDNTAVSCVEFGRLYDWQTALIACPSGWHLPSDAEWTTLTNFLGGESVGGGKMKSKKFFNINDQTASNSSGFSAILGGYRNIGGVFYSAGYEGHWWSSSEIVGIGSGLSRALKYDSSDIFSGPGMKSNGFSCRCVKD